jgi:hypothetical protein
MHRQNVNLTVANPAKHGRVPVHSFTGRCEALEPALFGVAFRQQLIQRNVRWFRQELGNLF